MHNIEIGHSTGRGTPRPGRAERQERGEPVAFEQPATNAEDPERDLLAGSSGEAARDSKRAEGLPAQGGASPAGTKAT